uniref:Probable inactive 2-oxoglutarate-dependent dioxygenase AOP2 n=1 Tax=Arabidopsis thaliana TaxID=3702 RepID=AOP2C_ARATH|nr:RecName: Full=Probable inactive 2-oxoglutarate-dependent dioxygenase AOP2 [Arabidopsis thaliana]AAC79099.1 putative oxidoreductase [Arabidopsis thaliana]CAB77791.1 putative oxidoreductase [Arabidopsis thaliana]
MGSCSLQLPLINLADKTLEPGSSKWAEVRSDVRKALEDFGCFEASYDKVSLELQESIMKTMEELFALPVETKQRNVCPKPYVGYLNHNNLSESLGISNANILENINEFTQQLWPHGDGNENISKTIQLFAEKLVEIDVMVRRMVMESFGIEKYIDDHLKSTAYATDELNIVGVEPNVGVKVNADISDDVNANASVNAGVGANVNADTGVNDNLNVDANVAVGGGVNANTDLGVGVNVNSNVAVNAKTGGDDVEANDDNEEKKLGLPCHTDKNLFTVLFQHEIEGLEVKTKDEKWIRVKPSPNTFIVIAGDSLCALMNGRIRAPYHRVRVTEKKRTRYTAAIFTCPKPDYVIEAPKELVDEKHPRLFRPFDYRDLFTFYHSEAGRKIQYTLQAYCAVSEA